MAANGLKAVQRATLPLALIGRAQFGAYLGRLALPQGIVAAVAPLSYPYIDPRGTDPHRSTTDLVADNYGFSVIRAAWR